MNYMNNPLNIRYTNRSQWKGLVGSRNGFCQFSHIKCGVRAALYLILKTYRKRGWITLEDVISHWAPESDGNDTAHYLYYVQRRTGLNCTSIVYQLPKNQLYDLILSMGTIESGYYIKREDFDEALKLL